MKKLLCLLFTTGLSACSDTEQAGPTNHITYDGERYPIFSAFCLETAEDSQTQWDLSFFDQWLDTPPATATGTYFECSLPEAYFGQRLDLFCAPLSQLRLALKVDDTLVLRIESSSEGDLLKYTETGVEMIGCVVQAIRIKEAFAVYLSAAFSDGRECVVSFKGYPMGVE